MRFGPRWDSVAEAWRDGDEVMGRLELADRYRDELDAWRAHPALVDVATAFGMVLGDHDRLHVPIGYDEVTSAAPLPASPWVRARLDGQPSDDLLRLDLALGDAEGNVVLSIAGLALRPVSDSEILANPTADEHAPTELSHRVPPLLAVAAEHGIVDAEGAEMLERLLGSGRRRLIASSIELDDVAAIAAPTPTTAPDTTTDAPDGAPVTGRSVVSTIQQIWIEQLGVPDIGLDEDFFDAGGHSLIAIRMLSRVHKELGVRLQLATMFEAPTISALAAEVLKVRPGLDEELSATPGATSVAPSEQPRTQHRSLVPISTSGDGRALFVVHGAGGNVLFLWTLARAFAGTRPVYGFQAHGVDGHDMPDPSIEAMAERYVNELRAAHSGPYLLGGYSGGGIVAVEMARQLQALGEEVDRIVLFDSPLPGEAELSAGQQWIEFARNTRRYGFQAMKPYLRWRLRQTAVRFFPAARKAGRDEELTAAARQIGALDVEDSGFVDLFYYFSAAAERYEVRPLEVDMVLVKADRVWPVHAHDYHWSRYIRGRIDVISTPGDHWAMFYPENVPHLAHALMPLLDDRGR
jgi:thioesterase domain-containing protein/acyl carrier protein